MPRKAAASDNAQAPSSQADPANTRYAVFSAQDPGKGKVVSEDYLGHGKSLIPGGWIFCLADGMGGYAGGRQAAKIAVSSVLADFARVGAPGLDPSTLALHLVENAHERLNTYADQENLGRLGCTLALAMCLEGTLALAGVGDTRVYLFRDKKLEMVSRDHTLVAQLVREGELTPDQATSHPMGHILTQALTSGADTPPEPWVETFKADLATSILMATDGVHGSLDQDFMARTLATTFPQDAVKVLVSQARLAGSKDDASAMFVRPV